MMRYPIPSRVFRTKDQAKTTYNQLSRWYDWLAGSSERELREIGLRLLNVQARERVLEIGFGTGHSIAALARAVGNEGKVYGIDLAEGMCARTQARVQAAGLSERVELHCGDATNLNFPSDFFDAVFMSFTLELFDTPEIPLVLSECRRVLRNQGRLVIVAMDAPRNPNWATRLYEWVHRRIPSYIDCRPIPGEMILQENGFSLIQVVNKTLWNLPIVIALVDK